MNSVLYSGIKVLYNVGLKCSQLKYVDWMRKNFASPYNLRTLIRTLHTSSCSLHFASVYAHCFFLFLMSVYLIFPAQLKAQNGFAHPAFVIDRWGIEDGLPVNNVVKLIQSQDGYLWLATFDGLVRFDGVRFEVYQSESRPGLPSNRLINIREASDGSLWMETEPGFLVKFQHGEFRHIRQSDGLNGSIGLTSYRDPSGNLWFGSDFGISFYNGETLAPYEPDLINGRVNRLFVQRNGTVWCRIMMTLCRFDNDEFRQVHTSHFPGEFMPVFEDHKGTVWFGSGLDIFYYEHDSLYLYSSLDFTAEGSVSIGQDAEGRIWVASKGNGFYRLEGGRAIHFEPSQGELYTFLESFYVDEQEQFWMFSRNGVWKDGEKILGITDDISDYVIDREGNLWIGTWSEGLIRIKPNPFVTWSTPEGLPNRNVYPVLEDREGGIWVGTFGDGVAKIKNGIVERGPPFQWAPQNTYVQSLHQTTDGTILAGVLSGGVFELKPGSNIFTRKAQPSVISNDQVFAIYEQKNGHLWLGTGEGLFVKKGNNWHHFSDYPVFFDHYVRFFLESPDGSLWMATNGAGIVRYKNDDFEFFGIEEGLGSNLVRSLFIEPEAYPDSNTDPATYVLWVGTEDRGLLRLEISNGIPDLINRSIYGTSAGMPDYVIHIILRDDDNNFWFNTNRGIFTVSKQQLEAFHRNEIPAIRGVSYRESDGLRNREGNGGVQWAGIRASDGSLWLPGQDGVVVVDPAGMTVNDRIPPVVIEDLQTGGKIILNKTGTPIKLASDERDFEIRFTGLSLTSPEEAWFRYRLAGYNDAWQEVGDRRNAMYTNIPAGTYTFEVTASNNSGLWNPEPASVTIIVAPRFVETAGFRLLVLVLLAGVFFGGIRWRVSALKKNELRLKKLVDEKTSQLTREKRITEEQAGLLQEQADRLQELDRAKTRFFTNITHEFRTPLTLITGPLQRMLTSEDGRFNAETRQEFEMMLRNSDRLLRLINQTLDLTHLEHGKVKLRITEIELNEFLESLTELFRPVCNERDLELIYQPADSPCHIFADPDKLDKIIANLLSNAVKFTPQGGRITVTINDIDGGVEIGVSDTGIGIPHDELEKVFNRFYQVDSSETRFHEGSGVGLSLANEFSILHHGELRVNSELGRGSTFLLSLKKGYAHFTGVELDTESSGGGIGVRSVTAVNDSKLGVKESGNSVNHNDDIDQGEKDDRDRVTILVVEDNHDLRSFICSILGENWRTIEASNGKEALDLVSSDLPDLVIADIMMPEMDGLTFNRMLKSDPATAFIPLIFLTAKASKEHHIEGFDEGADAYITKPFDPDMLKAQVRNLIGSRYRLREWLLSEKNDSGSENRRKPPSNPFLKKVEDILSENYTDPGFTVARLAELLYMDRSQVLRKLKQHTGLSPAETIKKYRMEEASRLLVDQAGNISEVACAVGYNSLAYFSYAFKEYYGSTPTEYVMKSGAITISSDSTSELDAIGTTPQS